MGSKQQSTNLGENGATTTSARHSESEAPSNATTSSAEITFVQKASAKLVAVLEKTNNKNKALPPHEQLLSIAQDICDKLFDKGQEYAQTRFADLVMALEDESNEDLRAKIRNRSVSSEDVANLKLMDLLTAAQKAELQLEAENDFKAHNVKDITRAVATVTKETCPSCGHPEAAILESNNAGGEPRFWSGGELEEQQQLTLYRCMNCSNEFSGESKF